ncbi:MAG TPA: hypothetical protein VEL69_01035 [Ktedonobacteraceae bacterium]|nr:hypothetical protein [Ktedonobacteraceae bacterium]
MRMIELDESKRPETMVIVKQQLQHIAVGLAAGQVGSVQPLSLPGNVVFRTSSTASPIQAPLALPVWGTLLVTYREHTALIRSIAWSPNGEYIASAGEDCIVCVWRAGAGGGTRFRYTNHSEWIYAVAWSPDGKRILLGLGDHTAQIWDVASGRKLLTYRGHADRVYSVSWSPDGSRIASGGSDRTVQVWETATGKLMFTYQCNSSAMRAVA